MSDSIQCTYIGHATTLLKMGTTTLLTDPHLGKRVWLAKRHAPLEFDHAQLDDLAAVLISHMHYDHLDIGSYKYIASRVPLIVPEGTEPMVGRLVANPVIELSHWATHELVDGTQITAVPLHHRGGRFSQLRYRGSNGYIVQKDDETIFFCGDSSYGPTFGEIGNLYHIDVALLPIGSYEPRWFMRKRHMTPAEAVTAFEDLKARRMIPIHWGTFKLSLEKLDAPIAWLKRIIDERPELGERIDILEPGTMADIATPSSTKTPSTKSAREA